MPLVEQNACNGGGLGWKFSKKRPLSAKAFDLLEGVGFFASNSKSQCLLESLSRW